MTNSLNKVTLIGNLGRDPEVRHTNDGKEIASFSLATSESWRDKTSGEKKERTEWHRIVVFSEGLVNIIKSYVKKGSKIYIEGSLQTRKWQDNTGQEKYTTEVVLQGYSAQLILLDKKDSVSSYQGTNSTNNYSESSRPASSDNNFMHSDLDDDIPF